MLDEDFGSFIEAPDADFSPVELPVTEGVDGTKLDVSKNTRIADPSNNL